MSKFTETGKQRIVAFNYWIRDLKILTILVNDVLLI